MIAASKLLLPTRRLKALQSKSLAHYLHYSHILTSPLCIYRQEAMLRSYHELVMRIPLVKNLVEVGDAEALEALYRNVSCVRTPYQ